MMLADAPADTAPIAIAAAVQSVVVNGARLPPAVGDAAFAIARVSPLALATSERLDEALSSAPGFSLFRRTSSLGANPTTQGASLRGIAGSGASRALVSLDGVPQNDPFGGWVIWTSLPPETVDGASLVRGAGAGPYGAGALTGVVDLQEPARVAGGSAGEASFGDHGYRRASGVVAVTDAPVSLILNAASENSDGWIPVRQGRGAADRPLTLSDWTAGARIEADLGAVALAARLAGYDERRGAGTLDANSRERGAQASITAAAQPTASALGWRLQAWLLASNLSNTSAAVSADRDTATLANDQYATPAVGVGFNAAIRRAAARHSWEIGVDIRQTSGESREHLYSQGVATGDRVSGGDTLVAGLYGEASESLGAWLVTGGGRLDLWRDYAGKLIQTGASPLDEHPADRSGVAPTGRIGLRRDIAGSLYMRAAAYAGFRPATLNELHRSFRVKNDVTEANANLNPERLYGGEAGVGGGGAWRWDVTAFYNRLEGAITNVTVARGPVRDPIAGFIPLGGTLFERQNVRAVNAVGVEADLDRPLTPRLSLELAANLTRARVDGGAAAPQLTGLRPALTPQATATAALDWRVVERLSISGELRYESARFDDDLNTRRIAGGATAGARATWRVSSAVSFYLAADNLFNAAIQTSRSADGVVTYDAPRMVRIGASLRR